MLDIIVVLVVAFGFYAGYSRGLIKTVFDTLGLLVGILASMKLSSIVIDVLDSFLNVNGTILYLVGVVITFLLVMGLIRFVGKKIEDILEAANINILNKVAGGTLQGLFFAFLLSMLLWTLGNYNVIKPEVRETSVTYPLLEPLPEAGKSVFKAVKPIFQDFWQKTVDVMEDIGGKVPAKEE